VNTDQIGWDNARSQGINEKEVATVKVEDDQDKSGHRSVKEVTKTINDLKANKELRQQKPEIY
jgi:hypothetical protein